MTTPFTPPAVPAFEAAVTVTIAGDLTSTSVGEAQVALSSGCDRIEAPGASHRVLRIDLRKARMVDSVGLNLLVGVIKRVRAVGGRTELLVAATNVERILTFTRLHQIARVIHDV